jgi:hypothetical protein
VRWTTETVAVRVEAEMDRLFYDFVVLADAPDDKIVAFAKRWGVLGLCQKHDLPMCHRGSGMFEPATEQIAGLGPVCPPRRNGAEYVEPLAGWRQWATIAGSTLTLARQLRQGENGDPAAWQVIYGKQPTAEDPLAALASSFMLWQWSADLRPIVAASPAGGVLRLWLVSYDATISKKVMDESARLYPSCGYRGGLFGILATHLLLATNGGPGSYAHCSNCRTLFAMQRNIPEGRNRFCPECTGGKVARRLSKRRARELQRANRTT